MVLLEKKILNAKALKNLVKRINSKIRKYNSDYEQNYSEIKRKYEETLTSLNHITEAIEKGLLTDNLIVRAETLETEKASLETRLKSLQMLEEISYSDVEYLLDEYKELKRNTEEFRTFLQQFVKEIKVFPYHFEVVLDISLGFIPELTEMISMRRGELYELFESKVKEEQ